MIVPCLKTFRASKKVGCVVNRPSIAIVITINLCSQVVIDYGVAKRPAGFSVKLLGTVWGEARSDDLRSQTRCIDSVFIIGDAKQTI